MRVGPRTPKAGRRWVLAATLLTVVALAAAVVGAVGLARTRTVPDDAQRHALLAQTSAAVTALMTFGPGTAAPARGAVEDYLTGPLLLRYRGAGPDVVLPGAVENDAAMSVRVVGVGVDTYADDRAQVIVFADQTISLPAMTPGTAPQPAPASVARWATMRNVGGNWRLADLDTVGDAGS